MATTGKGPVQATMTGSSRTPARPGLWPNGATFALFLSHDIDQIHDREMWRIIADLNHIRRVVFGGETGSARLAAARVARALFKPKPATRDFATILEIEARWGFKSPFSFCTTTTGEGTGLGSVSSSQRCGESRG